MTDRGFGQLPPAGGPQAPGPLARLLGFAIGAVVLVASLVFSVVVFAVLLGVFVIVGAYLWWRTRELRRQIREQMREQAQGRGPMQGQRPFGSEGSAGGPRDGDVLDGDFIRESRRGEDREPDR